MSLHHGVSDCLIELRQPTADLPSGWQGSSCLPHADKPQPLVGRRNNQQGFAVKFGGKPTLGRYDGDMLIADDHASSLYSLLSSGSCLPTSSKAS